MLIPPSCHWTKRTRRQPVWLSLRKTGCASLQVRGGREVVLKGFQELCQAFPTTWQRTLWDILRLNYDAEPVHESNTDRPQISGILLYIQSRTQIEWCQSWYSAGHCQTCLVWYFLWEHQLLTFGCCFSEVSWRSLFPPHHWATGSQMLGFFFFKQWKRTEGNFSHYYI